MLRNGIAGSYSNSTLNFPRNLHMVLHMATPLFCWSHAKLPLSLHPLDNSHPNECEVVPHCGFDLPFPGLSDVEHLFICLLWIVCCLCWNVCSSPLPIIYLFLLLSCRNSLCIFDINPLSDTLFANIFSHSIGCLFTLLIVSFAVQKLFNSM